jgi:hypothetical protein
MSIYRKRRNNKFNCTYKKSVENKTLQGGHHDV